MLARLRERWQMRGRAAELARWNAGQRSGQRVQLIPMLKSYLLGEAIEAWQLRDRVWELVAWNRSRAKLAWYRSSDVPWSGFSS